MSASDIAVSVRGLSKSYTIAHQGEKHVTLAEQLLAKARRPFARALKETFWALKDVEFDIKKGDVVGIIGRNGAGKSTLLKILSRITEPTAGTIDLYGRVGSLLEVGTGFHPELTGRENVFLNGAILGMTKAEIRKQFDAIVDFAGVEQFLDTPVKRYSSGMYVRLAFAVAAHLRNEILVIDEVLAVGDTDFQRKCLGKMQDVSKDGRTVLFVSHNAAAVRTLCTCGIMMTTGTASPVLPTSDALTVYMNRTGFNTFVPSNGPLQKVQVEQIGVRLRLSAQFKCEIALKLPGLGFVINTADGIPIFGTNPMRQGITRLGTDLKQGTVTATIATKLLDGQYTASVWFGDGTHDFVNFKDCVRFRVAGMAGPKTGEAHTDGPVVPDCDWHFSDE